MTPESSLSGTVVTAGDARPVDGAIVAVALDDDELGASVRSDAQGRFRLTRLVPGRYQPDASGDGYRGEAGESVLLGLGQSVDGVAIVVHPASRVRGTVVIDRGGGKVEPCPRGSVMLTDPASRARARDSLAPDGTFAILSLAPGRYEVRVRCNGARRAAAVPARRGRGRRRRRGPDPHRDAGRRHHRHGQDRHRRAVRRRVAVGAGQGRGRVLPGRVRALG